MSNFFWNKKKIVSYFLAMFVLWSHSSAFINYDMNSNIVNYGSILFKDTITKLVVPLFFIISGALYFRDYSDSKYIYKNSKRIKTLVIPFLIWNTIGMLFNLFASTFFSSYFINREKITISSFTEVFLGIFHYKYNIPFWYIFALICFSIISPLIDKLIKTKTSSFITIGSLIILLYFGIGMPYPLFYWKDCLVYYLAGCFVGRFALKWFSEHKNKKYSAISLLLVIIFIIVAYYIKLNNLDVNLAFRSFFRTFFCLALWFSFDLFINEDFVSPNFMNHSFIVFATHSDLGGVCTKLMYLILPKYNIFCYVTFTLSILTTLIIVELFCYLINKISPNLYNVISGSR